MRSEPITKPMISLDVLGKMVRTLSTDQLAKLPLEKLPESVPDIIYTIGTPEKNAILEDLLIRRDSERMHRQVSDTENYGKDVAEAFSVAESNQLPPLVIEFSREVQTLTELTSAAKSGTSDEKVIEKHKAVKEILSRLTASAVLRAEQVMIRIRDDKSIAVCEKRVARALRRLNDKLAPASLALAKYQELRLGLVHREMSDLRKRIKKQAAQQSMLQEEIDSLNRQLQDGSKFLARTIGNFHSSGQYSETQEQIKQLIARKKMAEVPIDDKDLVDWLDAIVDASMVDVEPRHVHAARMLLLSLLELYCRQQEESALQIAQNPFSQVDPKKAISFVLALEQFILDYFVKKQEQAATLFRTTAANRRQRLDLIMKGLVKELKRNLRKLKS